MEPKRLGNWTPDGKAERAALRRDYRELTPVQWVEQVIELSPFMSQVAEAGHRRRLAWARTYSGSEKRESPRPQAGPASQPEKLEVSGSIASRTRDSASLSELASSLTV